MVLVIVVVPGVMIIVALVRVNIAAFISVTSADGRPGKLEAFAEFSPNLCGGRSSSQKSVEHWYHLNFGQLKMRSNELWTTENQVN